jgi:hypothetical protein
MVTLTIPAGTRIESGGNHSSTRWKTKCKWNSRKTSNNDSLPNKFAGDWGGLVICGKAYQSHKWRCWNCSIRSSGFNLRWTANDNSGSFVIYVSSMLVQHSTAKKNLMVFLYLVFSGTTFEYVEAYQGADDGFEFLEVQLTLQT